MSTKLVSGVSCVAFVALLIVVAGLPAKHSAVGADPQAQAPAVADGPVGATVNAVGNDTDGFSFSPSQVIIQVGQSVKFVDTTGVDHTVTRNDAPAFNNLLPANGSTTITFSQASNAQGFSYFCMPHPEMTGTVVVRLAGSNNVPTDVQLKELMRKMRKKG
jgi:plastocyanin